MRFTILVLAAFGVCAWALPVTDNARALVARHDNDEQIRYPDRDEDIRYPDAGLYAESG